MGPPWQHIFWYRDLIKYEGHTNHEQTSWHATEPHESISQPRRVCAFAAPLSTQVSRSKRPNGWCGIRCELPQDPYTIVLSSGYFSWAYIAHIAQLAQLIGLLFGGTRLISYYLCRAMRSKLHNTAARETENYISQQQNITAHVPICWGNHIPMASRTKTKKTLSFEARLLLHLTWLSFVRARRLNKKNYNLLLASRFLLDDYRLLCFRLPLASYSILGFLLNLSLFSLLSLKLFL